MKPSKTDCEVIALGESYSDDESVYVDKTPFQIVSEEQKFTNYDSENGYADTEYTYIIKHPDYPEYWRFIYTYCSWDGGGVEQPEQVVKRAKVVEVWEAV